MIRQHYEFLIELFDRNARPLGRSIVKPDWGPLAEHVHFSGMLSGVLPPVMSQPPAELLPLWRPKRGEPFVKGLRIEMSSPNGKLHGESFPLDCFKEEAKRLSGEHVATGALTEGDVFRYRVVALPREHSVKPPGRIALMDFEEIEQPLVLTESSIQDFFGRSMSMGARSGIDDGVLPVFVAQELIAQCVDQVRAAGELETGGILIGRLHQDRNAPEARIFLEITGQIPAQHTDQQEMRVTFTDKTWAAARDALALRKSDESIVGWLHSHPDFCGKCSQAKRADCTLNGIFFSKTDIALHRTMFPRAWQVGLLFSNRPAGIIPAMYGWQRGSVAARPFHLMPPANRELDAQLLKTLGTVQAPVLATVGGDEYGHTH